MFCLATKILTYLPFFYLIIFMTSNCQDALGRPDNSFMREILFLKMQMQGKKRSKIGHLARLFNAADAFSEAKYTRKSKCQDALLSPHSCLQYLLRPKGGLL